jgi:hypothetical protein
MSAANTALLYNLGLLAFPVTDDLSTTANNTQTAAPVLIGELCRVVTAVANGSFVLKQLLTLEAPPLVFVVNDSANTIKVFSFIGETLNGGANGALSIPTGQSGIFISVPGQKNAGVTDWRAAVIP